MLSVWKRYHCKTRVYLVSKIPYFLIWNWRERNNAHFFFLLFFSFLGRDEKVHLGNKKKFKKKKETQNFMDRKTFKISLKTQKNKTSFSFLSPSSLLFFSPCTSKAPSITLSALRRTRLMAQRCSACRWHLTSCLKSAAHSPTFWVVVNYRLKI